MADAILADQRFDDGQDERAGDDALVAERRREGHVHLVTLGTAIGIGPLHVRFQQSREASMHVGDQGRR